MAFDFTSLIPVVGDLLGGLFGSNANNKAAKAAEKALDKQIQAMREAEERAVARLELSKAAARELYDPYMKSGAAGEQHFLKTLGLPEGMMTDAQRIGLEDLDRRTRRDLATSGLRGAGRAGVAVLGDAKRRYVADTEAFNRARADDAAGKIYGTGFSATSGAANAEMGVGANVASTVTGTGVGVGNALAQIGQEQGNAITANGDIWGQTIGSIGGAIADFAKRGRASRYSGLDYVA